MGADSEGFGIKYKMVLGGGYVGSIMEEKCSVIKTPFIGYLLEIKGLTDAVGGCVGGQCACGRNHDVHGLLPCYHSALP